MNYLRTATVGFMLGLLVATVAYAAVLSNRLLAAQAMPSVVSIHVTQGHGQFRGAGAILDQNHIITVGHLFPETGEFKIQIFTYPSYRWISAKLVAVDHKEDLALLKLVDTLPEGRNIRFGDSRMLQPGDPIMLIGNPFGLLNWSVSCGVVSFIRKNPDRIQTDAAANPGNSGGPAFDEHGGMVGLLSGGYGMMGLNSGVNIIIPETRIKDFLDANWMALR